MDRLDKILPCDLQIINYTRYKKEMIWMKEIIVKKIPIVSNEN